jgi:hypothetical protein
MEICWYFGVPHFVLGWEATHQTLAYLVQMKRIIMAKKLSYS